MADSISVIATIGSSSTVNASMVLALEIGKAAVAR
jgi:hypothetical protein